MRAVIQRVSRAAVRVDGEVVGSIGTGLCVLLCAMAGDNDSDARFTARKLTTLRVFPDTAGKMNLSVQDVGAAVLLISQFTLAAETTSGTRPSFSGAAAPELAEQLYDQTCRLLRAAGIPVATGVFAARMEVELVNDGPVTIVLDSRGRS
jgi:D-tyrosyl-tRNA(Tyr) deacylase